MAAVFSSIFFSDSANEKILRFEMDFFFAQTTDGTANEPLWIEPGKYINLPDSHSFDTDRRANFVA